MLNKLSLLVFTMLIVLSFSACSIDRNPGNEPESSSDKVTSAPAPTDHTAIETSVPSSTAYEDAEALEIIVQKCGYPFRFYCPVDMECTVFRFYEASAKREYNNFYGKIEHHDLGWEIVGNEMIVTGDWNERFTVDLETFTATSQTDGLVYRIVSED